MNTNIHMTLETLPFSFRMAKGIWKSKVIQVILPKKRTTTPNKEISGNE